MAHKWVLDCKRFDSNLRVVERHTFAGWKKLRDIDEDLLTGAGIAPNNSWSMVSVEPMPKRAEPLEWGRFYEGPGVYVAHDSEGNEYQAWARMLY